jgi:cryptochrome
MGDVSKSLTSLNKNSKLLVVRGSSISVLPSLFEQWKISHLVFEKDTAGYAAARDAKVKDAASKANVEVLEILGHTLYDPELVVKANGGKGPTSLSVWNKVRPPPVNASTGAVLWPIRASY